MSADSSFDQHHKQAIERELAKEEKRKELAEKRRKSQEWINTYVVTGTGTTVLLSLVPGASTAALIALESTMVYQIGSIYRPGFTLGDAMGTIGLVSFASLAGKFLALESAILLGPWAFYAKPAIAGGIIKAMGMIIIKHFEDAA